MLIMSSKTFCEMGSLLLASPGYHHAGMVLDCYTVFAWWQWDCHLGARHGLQLAGINRSWLVGLDIAWDCLGHNGLWGSCEQWECPPFFSSHWQSPCTALMAGNLGLCKETVKESRHGMDHTRPAIFMSSLKMKVSNLHDIKFGELTKVKNRFNLLGLLMLRLENLEEPGGCWCPGCFCHQVISSHGID